MNIPTLEVLARALLLFHSPSPWHQDKQQEWERLTGTKEATTKNLCDLARMVIRDTTSNPSL